MCWQSDMEKHALKRELLDNHLHISKKSHLQQPRCPPFQCSACVSRNKKMAWTFKVAQQKISVFRRVFMKAFRRWKSTILKADISQAQKPHTIRKNSGKWGGIWAEGCRKRKVKFPLSLRKASEGFYVAKRHAPSSNGRTVTSTYIPLPTENDNIRCHER